MNTPWPQPQQPDLYVDEVQYAVRMTPHPAGYSEAITEGFVVWWSDMGVSLDEARSLVPGVAWNADKGYFEPYVARQSYSQTEWGASGYGLQFVVDLANNMATETVMLSLGYVVARLRGNKKREHPLSLDIETASVSARQALVAVFEEKWDDLVVDEATKVNSTARFVVSGRGGRYEATVGCLEETGDPFCHVRRLAPESPEAPVDSNPLRRFRRLLGRPTKL